MMSPRVINIVVAAGSGSRFGSELPKQFCRLGGRSVLDHALERI
ncbi:MAG: 2-C-methyl-D-erythritol 4-phosphate cytidylyltransferase [Muribaculaceae bacterium]|nr:2-C-methyl-D-erythritol 4-phosphate cytidylyltransferase [Muribaculaceae bacterium]